MRRRTSKARGAVRTPQAEGYFQIGTSARVDGKLEGTGLVLVHGRLSGEAAVEGDLVVAHDGEVRDLRGYVERLRIEGRSHANLRVGDAVEVAHSGRLSGSVEASFLQASRGAVIDAQLRIQPREGAVASDAEAAPTGEEPSS